ncbi:hypothetical protein SAMN05518801_101105 [Novosphingobium sp. CF614]|uniref:DUF6127 family protein n=1 Tax=Novosphingobium sp. CF614 TaxID=1884364 RepID=UPI0008ED6720|nr:DUF6127 family protein [Novosphingobium sp. CF614]SFF73865.1 hypothetical protein SAMN05518801_101105 [Novosphingobium sp. CF614]
MNNGDMLAGLLAQATGDGGDLVTLRAIVEEASEIGARRMLERIGLDDETAPRDLGELRELLQAWRDAKASARTAALGWIVRALLALLLLGLAVRLGVTDLLR